jgi:non-specific serine/threonine protein kinase/serine/threonine-protein kinase
VDPREPAPSIRDVFDFALALPDDEREAYVSRLAESDPDLARELRTLLEADAAAGTFLSTPAADQVALFGSDLTGLHIGPYRVLRRVGSGGMGAVYLAERVDESFERQVAVKVVRLGFGIEERIARFQRERQILAQLDHPNIASLIDGGTMAGGVPYLVMEYVEGTPIDVYCREANLPVADRLRLFMKVCAAVQFAHQRLVIHRDIKPNNILVDAGGEPKLLDFGIATILEPTGAEQDQLTHTGCFLVTPDYASPEQVRGELVTTASDVYALGVVLYLLLAGRPPYRVTSRSPQEIVRAVCDTQPVSISDAVVEARPDDDRAAAERERVARALRGDLDTIVAKALHKDPARRYASPARLADDLRRHLEGRPVHARPDTPSYRLAKFVGRNKAGVSMGAALVLAIVIGTAATIWQAGEATRQREIAEQRLAGIRRLSTSFLFEVNDAIAMVPGATPARQRMSHLGGEYLDRLVRESADDPALLLELAEAYDRLGDMQGNPAMANLGNDVAALASYRKALAIREDVVAQGIASATDAGLDASYVRIGDELVEAGTPVLAAREYGRALEIREAALAASPDESARQRRVLDVAIRLCRTAEGTPGAAARVAHCSRALQLVEPFVADDPSDVALLQQRASVLLNLGESHAAAGAYRDAFDTLRRAEEAFAGILAIEPDDLRALRGRSLALGRGGAAAFAVGDRDTGTACFSEARIVLERLVSRDPHSTRYRLDTAALIETEADAHARTGDRARAASLIEEALATLPQDDETVGPARQRLTQAREAYRR